MGQIVDITYARMLDELERLTANLINEDQVTTSTDYLDTHLTALPAELHHRAQQLVRRRRRRKRAGDMKVDYYNMMVTLGTWRREFMFLKVVERYRSGINPVRALYYESVRVYRGYNPNDEYHVWLTDQITNAEFSHRLINTLQADIKALESFVSKYYGLYQENNMPVEMFHSMYTLEDYREYLKFFKSAVKNHPEARG